MLPALFLLALFTAVVGAAVPTLDGVIDAEYATNGSTVDFAGFESTASASLSVIDDTSVDPDNVWLAWEVSTTFNDLTYGEILGNNKHSSWGGTGHVFSDLAESDLQRIILFNTCGDAVVDATMDLLDGYAGQENDVCGNYTAPLGFDPLDLDGGRLDISGPGNEPDGNVDTDDDGVWYGFAIVDAYFDVDADGIANETNGDDDGTIFGWTIDDGVIKDGGTPVTGDFNRPQVIDGEIDMDGNGTAGQAGDDGTLLGFTIIDGRVDIDEDGDVGTIGGAGDSGDRGEFLRYDVWDSGVDFDNDDDFDVDDDGVVMPTFCGQSYATVSGYDANMDTSESVKGGITDVAGVGDDWTLFEFDTSMASNFNDFGYCAGGAINGEGDCDLTIIDGRVDVDRDGDVDALDDDTISSVDVIDGRLDMDDSGIIDGPDDGTFFGYTIIDGEIDVDADGTAGETNGDDNGETTDLVLTNPPWSDEPNYVPDAAYADYEPSIIWEMKIDRRVFESSISGTACAGGTIAPRLTNPIELHASPPKIGDSPVLLRRVTSAIGDTVWLDVDQDGVEDAGEPGIPNVLVQLYSDPNRDGNPADGELLATTYTDLDGQYIFEELGSGDYTVVVLSDQQALTGLTRTDDTTTYHDPIDLGIEEAYLLADFGYAPPSANAVIGDFVWSDADNDGVQDLGEPGIGGVTLELRDTSGTVVATTTTGDDGFYLFTGVAAGEYIVALTDDANVLSGYTITTGPQSVGAEITTPISVEGGDSYLNADFGYYQSGLGTIGNQIWFDTTEDGTFDSDGADNSAGTQDDEPGLGNITVALLKDLDGDGTRDTSFEIIDGRVDIDDDGGIDGDDDGILGGVSIIDGRLDIDSDGSIGTADDGTFDGFDVINGEIDVSGGGGITAVDDGSTRSGEPVIANTITASDGTYSFDGLDLDDGDGDADYLVAVTDTQFRLGPYDKVLGPNAGSDNNSQADPYAAAISGGSTSNQTADFGYRYNPTNQGSGELGLVGDTVWYDLNDNGTQDDGEEGVEGVTVYLYSEKNGEPSALLGTATTDRFGRYFFPGLDISSGGGGGQSGAYYTIVGDSTDHDTGNGTLTTSTNNFASGGVLEGFTETNPNLRGTANDRGTFPNTSGGKLGEANPLTSAPNNIDLTLDYGYDFSTGAIYDIGDTVWYDTNADGHYLPNGPDGIASTDDDEPGIAGVTLALYVDSDGNGVIDDGEPLLATDTTDASGNYLFENLPDGNYIVAVTDVAGVLTGARQTYGMQEQPGSISGADNLDVDFGYVRESQTGSIGDYVWFDADRDGVQDSAEDGIANVKLTLYEDTNGNGMLETGSDTLIGTTTTDNTGHYLFTGLPSDTYFVDLDASTLPDGLAATTGTTDPHGAISLSDGEAYLLADFGYANDDVRSGIGDYVWYDADSDGVQDEGEVGIGGVEVTVTGPSGTFVVTTDADGGYWVGDLAPGGYTVSVNTATLPSGYNTTPTNGPASRVYLLPVGKDILYADFGFDGGTTGTIGDQVWRDTNGDGTYDADGADNTADTADDEEPIAGVTVALIDDANGDGTWDPDGADNTLGTSDDEQIIATDTTDASGNYLFTGLLLDDGGGDSDADYLVTVTDIDNVLLGLQKTIGGSAGSNNNSQVDPYAVALTGASPNNLTADFGYEPAPGTLGDFVWHDLNFDGDVDAGEPGFEGVTVELYLDVDGSGTVSDGDNLVRTTTTDQNGGYLFVGLTPAAYLVDVTDDDGVLTGFNKTTGASPGSNDNSQTDPYTRTLTAAAPSNLTADFGYQAGTPYTLSGTTFIDANEDTVFQDETSLYLVEERVQYVELFLYKDLLGNGVIDGDDPIIGTTVSDANGDYIFTDLPNGSYIVEAEATHSKVDGYFQTTQQTTNAVQPATINNANSVDNDFGYHIPGAGAIGNRVWLDENSDGYQDAGEPGIPNVEVKLYDSDGSLVGTTFTDPDGGYIFVGLQAGDYYVDVLDGTGNTTTSMDSGFIQTPPSTLTGADFGNQDHGTSAIPSSTLTGYAVSIGGANPLENLTADFGYNWAPSTDVNGNTNSGTIGDRVWVDLNGDGFQDPDEVGIAGVTLEIFTAGPDGLLGTGDDVSGGTDVTDDNGNYIFDDLDADAYRVSVVSGVPGGYTQTGDPDFFGTTGSPQDGATTSPIVLQPGDVFLNADFGYQPGGGVTGSIGDFVWFDAVPDGIYDADGADNTANTDDDEEPIAGVTVALIRDSNGDGTWDAGEPIIGVETTDANGAYLFAGLTVTDGAGTDDYLVWVNDTDNVLAELEHTNDTRDVSEPSPSSGIVDGAGISAVTDLTPTAVTDADFGYTAQGHETSDGLIGDTIFFDTNRDGDQDSGEVGVEGVLVQLYDSTGTTLYGQTTTDENGNYHFGGLTAAVAGTNYRVLVAASNFDDGGVLEGTTITADPDGGADNLSNTTITAAAPVDLDQDFGYAAPNTSGDFGSIGNLVWLDSNASGVKDAAETGIDGVTIDLYRDLNGNGVIDAGEPLYGTTTTAGGGAYLFSNLPTEGDGDADPQAEYIVDVTDTAGVLAGYWQTLGTAGVDDNSQSDPYALEIGSGSGSQPAPDNLTADFGYYALPAAVGNYAWFDENGDGIQGASEPVVSGVEFALRVLFADGSDAIVKTVTDATGFYSFQQLLLDEDHVGAIGGGEPTFTYSTKTPSGRVLTKPNVGSDLLDSDPEPVKIIDGRLDVDNDGDVDGDDDGVVGGVVVIDGKLDLDGDMGISFLYDVPQVDAAVDADEPLRIQADNGTFEGFNVITGEIDVDGSGTVTAADDGLALSGVPLTAQPVKGQLDVALTNVTDDIASYDTGFAIRDLSISTSCNDYTGSSPFTIATNTVSHTTSSVLDATGLSMVHTLDSAVTYSGFSSTESNGGTTTCTPSGSTVTCTLSGIFTPTDTWTVNIIVTYGGGSLQTVQNSATVSAIETDLGAANDDDSCGSTLPVTIASFSSSAVGDTDTVRFEWTTATEAGNVGFNIYEVGPEGRRKLNSLLIPTRQFESLDSQSYTFEASGVSADRFVIEDVAWNGKTRRHGTFELGQTFGQADQSLPIDWPTIRAEHEVIDEVAEAAALDEARARIGASIRAADAMASMAVAESAGVGLPGEAADALASLFAKGDKKNAKPDPQTTPFAKVLVDSDGLVRISYEALAAEGYDLAGVDVRDIALVSAGQPVPITVQPRSGRFGPGGYVEFLGQAADSIYTHDNAYYLLLDRKAAQRIGRTRARPPRGSKPEPHYTETIEVNRQRGYSASAASEDPFFDTYMLTYTSPRNWSFPLEVDNLVPGAGSAQLTVGAWGLTEWVGVDPDHHAIIGVNGVAVADETFDGHKAIEIPADLPDGLLAEGSNTVEITMPGDSGFAYDMIILDRYTVSYPRAFVARDGGLSFEAAGRVFEVRNLPSPNVVIYRVDHRGRTRQLVSMSIRKDGDTWAASFTGQDRNARYILATPNSLVPPRIESVRSQADILGGPADYLILAHPSFLDGIEPLAAHHEAAGLTVKTVNVLDIYEQYGNGVVGAQAIKDYLAAAQVALGYQFVLLVGGDTYDYLGYLGNSMSFVPTLYRNTHHQAPHTPVDPLFVDFDGDDVQDAAIGRLPVRTTAELASVVENTLAYAAKDYGGRAIFAADTGYARDSDDLTESLPSGWSVGQARLEQEGLAGARSNLIEGIEQGAALTNFVGHSGPTAWTFSGLFGVSDIQALGNVGKPTAVVQWGCWNTYHVAASTNTLGHALMLSGDRGAALVLGATTLTQDESELKLGAEVLPRLTTPGMPAGLAVMEAKQALAETDPDLLDVLLGWTLLGDPAAEVQSLP